MRKATTKVPAIAAMIILFFTPSVSADEAMLLNRIQQIEKQMSDMKLVMDAQQQKIAALELSKSAVQIDAPQADAGGKSFKENLKQSIGDADKWLKDLHFSGDFRLRYEALDMVDSAGKTTTSATRDRNRFRYRLRYGFTKKFHPDMEVGFRLVGVDAGGRTSTNETLDTQFAYKPHSVDRAYARYTPGWAKVGPVAGLDITAGKFENPIDHEASWMIWDSDVTPEGIYEKVSLNLFHTDQLTAKADLIAGQWILEEGAALASHDDAELYFWSGNLKTEVKGILEEPIETRHHLTFYNYRDFASRAGNFGAAGNNPVRDDGSLAAGDFDMWDVYTEVKLKPFGKLLPLTLFYDFVKNVGDTVCCDLLEPDRDKAWALGMTLGKAKQKGSWELSYTYALIEANAVPSVFTDGDFGGTDQRGSVIRAGYALTDNLKLQGSAFFTNNVSNPAPTEDAERRLFQLDLVWKI